MKLERIPENAINKLFRPTKLQKILEEFMNMPDKAVHCILEDGEYANVKSAHSSYNIAIKCMKLPIKVRTLDGELYLIKLDPDYNKEC